MGSYLTHSSEMLGSEGRSSRAEVLRLFMVVPMSKCNGGLEGIADLTTIPMRNVLFLLFVPKPWVEAANVVINLEVHPARFNPSNIVLPDLVD